MATISFELARGGAAVRPGTADQEDPSYNAVFTLTPRTPVFLPAGSVLSMQDVAIDVGAAAINFPEPVSFTMVVAPWKTYSTFNQTVVPDLGSVPLNPDYLTPLWVGDDVGGSQYTIDTRSATLTLPAGAYTPQGLAEALSTLTSAVPNPSSITSGGGNFCLGEVITSGSGVKYLWNFSGSPVARRKRGETTVSSGSTGIFIGCSGLTFAYDDDIGRAVLQYAHEPCLNSSSQEIADLVKDSNGVYWFNLDRSGVVILSCGFPGEWEVETNPFWRLGFARADLEPPGDPNTLELNPSDFPSYTHSEFSAEILVSNSTHLDTPFTSAGYQRLSTGPVGRAASSAPEGFGGRSPRLLVECNLVPPNYVCSDGYGRGILCAVSASFESEGYLWTSNSGAFTLPTDTVVSQITVSLLDPSRGYTPAAVGDDSSLVLRVDVPAGFSLLGGLSAPTIAQAPEKDERHESQRAAAPRRG